ncbi:MAG: hypothetical protein KA027_02715, partial [Candidatus Methanofastidiosum sp.]|nr:hypothetical protein [Methanofastidiosum sp.]
MISKIPPAKIIHLLIFAAISGNLMKFNPKLRKYAPITKYNTKKNNPPLAIFNIKKVYLNILLIIKKH